MARTYVPYEEKHKHPKGFGSLCPLMPTSEPQRLLEAAISVEGVGANKLWIAEGRWCFCAHPSPHAGPDAWHGFPVIGAKVDERVWAALRAAKVLSDHAIRRLRKQHALPDEWP